MGELFIYASKVTFFHPNGFFRLIVAGSWDGKVKIWCRESSDCLFTIANKVFNACIYIFSGVEQEREIVSERERGRRAREGEREKKYGENGNCCNCLFTIAN